MFGSLSRGLRFLLGLQWEVVEWALAGLVLDPFSSKVLSLLFGVSDGVEAF